MKRSAIPLLVVLAAAGLCGVAAQAPAAGAAQAPTRPKPTAENVAYGEHERQVLDFYQAKSTRPTPVLFFIHGGGWVAGDKNGVGDVTPYLNAGISVVSINYRYSWQAQIAGVQPPVEWPLRDAARALQFVRSKAQEWNLDKRRIGASGGSAGACSSLWLAFHSDLADRKSADPVARESTRLWCAAVNGAQTSLDPVQLKEWTPNSRYGGHAFGFMDPNDLKSRDTRFAEFLANREKVLPWIKEYSPIEHVTADDPPVYLAYTSPPALGQEQKDPTHTSNYGVKLQEKCKQIGVLCDLVYPGASEVKYANTTAYLVATLKGWPLPPMKPTQADVRYGPHERNVLDFYQAKSDKPTPLLFFIHGGGWVNGDKHSMASPAPYLSAGISVVSINYRYTSQAGDVKPPVKAPLDDAARALQFVRSKAKEWNIDKLRVCASGGSAGACSSLWLAFHDDRAEPNSTDPVARESTRLWCAAVTGAQTTLDPQQMREWTPNSTYGGHAFGFNRDAVKMISEFDVFLAGRETILPWIAEYSPFALVSKDDPPVYLTYGTPPALGQNQKDPTHTSNFGVKLQERCREAGVKCELAYPGAPDVEHATAEKYIIETLKAARPTGKSRASTGEDLNRAILRRAIFKPIRMPQLTQLTGETPEASRSVDSAPAAEPAPSLQELVETLENRKGRLDRRLEAARKLREFGPPALEALCAALGDGDLRVRLAAAESAGRRGRRAGGSTAHHGVAGPHSRIAERCPAPELLAAMENLPVTAAAPPMEVAALPQPAGPRALDPERLPRSSKPIL